MLYLLIALASLLFLFSFVFMVYHVYVSLFQPGAVYYPTTTPDVKQMLKLAQVTSADTLIDLGSGDGRILITAAHLGAKAIGYEISPVLVIKSRRLIKQLHLDHLATVRWQSLWKADLTSATVVTVYLIPRLMNRLHRLLLKTHHPLRVVSNDYPLPQLKPIQTKPPLYLYQLS